MHINVLLTLSTLTALSSNAAAQLPLGGLNGLGLSGLGSQGLASSQTPGPSSTPIPTLTKRPAKPTAFPSKASILPAPALNAKDGSDPEQGSSHGDPRSDQLEDSLLGGVF